MHFMSTVLMAAASGVGTAVEIIIWGGIVIAAVLLLGFVLMWVRRKYHPAGGAARPRDEAGFTVDDLERLHASGQISREEFKRLRSVALGLGGASGPAGDSSSSVAVFSDDEEAGETEAAVRNQEGGGTGPEADGEAAREQE
jgi:hypothetical protein